MGHFRVPYIRVPYYFGHLKKNPDFENYRMSFEATVWVGCIGLRHPSICL